MKKKKKKKETQALKKALCHDTKVKDTRKAGEKEGRAQMMTRAKAKKGRERAKAKEWQPRLEREPERGEDLNLFMQESRGKRSRENRNQRRAADSEVQERKRHGEEHGFPDRLEREPMKEGCQRWRRQKELEKENKGCYCKGNKNF